MSRKGSDKNESTTDGLNALTKKTNDKWELNRKVTNINIIEMFQE